MTSHSSWSIHDAMPKIGHAPLMLNCKIGRCGVNCLSSYNNNQFTYFGRLCQCSPFIAKCVSWKILDALLTLGWCSVDGSMMPMFGSLWRCCLKYFCPEWRPIVDLWITLVAQPLDYPRCKAITHWRSFDSHFQDGATSALLAFLGISAPNKVTLDGCDNPALWLPNV